MVEESTASPPGDGAFDLEKEEGALVKRFCGGIPEDIVGWGVAFGARVNFGLGGTG